jgi:hypothetical protein
MADSTGDLLARTIMAALPQDRRPTEGELVERATALRNAFPVGDDEFASILRHIESRLVIVMNSGTALSRPDHAPWLNARKASIEPFYWERFRTWLTRPQGGLTPPVVNTLDRVTDEVLDLSGDPELAGLWSRRGLVVGDVQSGKTATYTALSCKAADAGYRLIILLTGTLENLRRQTQERLDEGFVGLDSSEMLQQIRKNRAVGVGVIDNRRTAGVFTSRSRDFSKSLMNQLGFRLDAFQEPVLVVLKKNKSVIENLHNWLQTYNAGDDDKIAAPLLLIDDEADSASINTRTNDAPNMINAKVRGLLTLFHRSTYIGFTATPFANVFVDPDAESDMLGDDLFPRDFIYALEAPSNYVGPGVVFSDNRPGVLSNEDAVDWFPPRHKSTHVIDSLPGTLEEAIRAFILSSAIRDLRRERNPHRSMLVNVSRFTAVQNLTKDLADEYVRDLQRDIRNFSGLPDSDALRNAGLQSLYETWAGEFQDSGFSWDDVRAQLHESTQPVTVRSVNQSASASSLDYKSHLPAGLRVIAVGGDSLSRGLTLEGLSTSYFFRNSQAYDTLLQMGRWFGYRDGYADLCRLWLTDEAVHWYSHIWSATEELRDEFQRMRSLGLTPQDFGLRVRAHPDSLVVTARNKMRSAQTIVRDISLSGNGIETARLLAAESHLDANADLVERFVVRMQSNGSSGAISEFGSWLWKDVDKDFVAGLLDEFATHPRNHDFQSKALASFLKRNTDPVLMSWDIALPQGSGDTETFAGLPIRPQVRSVLAKDGDSSILVSGARARVGSRGVEREGLTREEVEAINSQHPGKNVSDKWYRDARTRPLLLIHVLRGTVGEAKAPFRPPSAKPIIALGLSFPRFDDSGIAGKVTYQVNMVEWRQMFVSEESDEAPEDDDRD